MVSSNSNSQPSVAYSTGEQQRETLVSAFFYLMPHPLEGLQ
jgi:hypothetical protein